MKPEAHGGDRLRMAALAGRAPDSLLDFSVNVRPEGAPEFLRLALCRALDHISAYPSPHAEEAMEAAARVYGLPADCFVFGNGTNELIHLLARVLKEDGTPCAAVIEPAFSEYALACGLAGLEVRHPDCGVRRDGDSDEDMIIPIILNGGAFEKGKELASASIKDIAPTITALMGAEPAKEWEGKALV